MLSVSYYDGIVAVTDPLHHHSMINRETIAPDWLINREMVAPDWLIVFFVFTILGE